MKVNKTELIVKASILEEGLVEDVKSLITRNSSVFEGEKVVLMADAHKGQIVPVGFTMTLRNGLLIPELLGSDIGCLDVDSEFLTTNGWKYMDEFVEGDEILQYDKNTDTSTFTKPINYITKDCEEFIHFKNAKGLDQMVSDEHKMLIWKGYKGTGYNLVDMRADEVSQMGKSLSHGYYNVKTSFNLENKDYVKLSDNEIRIDVMVSADGCIRRNNDGFNSVELHFSRERKIERAKSLLKKSTYILMRN